MNINKRCLEGRENKKSHHKPDKENLDLNLFGFRFRRNVIQSQNVFFGYLFTLSPSFLLHYESVSRQHVCLKEKGDLFLNSVTMFA